MFFSGGFPFFRAGHDVPDQRDLDECRELLGVDRTASAKEIQAAYRRLAKRHHPDKPGGDAEKFKAIQRACDALTAEKEDQGRRPRSRTEDINTPLKVTLEQLYTGTTKKIAVNRQVVDKKRGIKECSACYGSGMKEEVLRIGPIIQRVQGPCEACGGQGNSFESKSDREVLEVHIPKGAPDGHKISFREKADERPGSDIGDVVFILREQGHGTFKRRGADLFVERRISLVEALCGCALEITHLDGRKLLVKTAPGEIVRPLARGFDPLAPATGEAEWEAFEDADCPGIDSVAKAGSSDVGLLKRACETQLKKQGIDVGAFVVDGEHAYFKAGSREDIMAAKEPRKGATLYVASDPGVASGARLVKAVVGEGMPTLQNPFVYGNLFLILTIVFPDALTEEARVGLRVLLPPPLNAPASSADDPGVEVHSVQEMDPRASREQNRANMATAGDVAYEEDEGHHAPPGAPQCHQM